MVEYKLPKEEKKRIQEGYGKFLLAEDILKKLRAVGEPNPEAEVRTEEIKARAKRFAEVFDVDLPKE